MIKINVLISACRLHYEAQTYKCPNCMSERGNIKMNCISNMNVNEHNI